MDCDGILESCFGMIWTKAIFVDGFLSVLVFVVHVGCVSGLMSAVCIGASSCVIVVIIGMAGWGCAVFPWVCGEWSWQSWYA